MTYAIIVLLFLVEFVKRKELFSFSYVKSMLVFGLPLLVALCFWTARNYNVTGKIIPLEDNVQTTQLFAYDARLVAIWDLIGAWGGQITRWSPNSMGEYFLSRKPVTSQEAFSSRMLSSACNFDSIHLLQQNYLRSYDLSLPNEQRLQLAHRVIEQSYRYRKTFINEKPFQYYIVSPLALTGKFLYFKTVSYLPFPELAKMKLYQKIIKVFYILFFNVILICAAIGAILVLLYENVTAKLLLLYPLFYTFVMIVIFIASEQRYVAPIYPFFVLYAGFFMVKLIPSKYLAKFQ